MEERAISENEGEVLDSIHTTVEDDRFVGHVQDAYEDPDEDEIGTKNAVNTFEPVAEEEEEPVKKRPFLPLILTALGLLGLIGFAAFLFLRGGSKEEVAKVRDNSLQTANAKPSTDFAADYRQKYGNTDSLLSADANSMPPANVIPGNLQNAPISVPVQGTVAQPVVSGPVQYGIPADAPVKMEMPQGVSSGKKESGPKEKAEIKQPDGSASKPDGPADVRIKNADRMVQVGSGNNASFYFYETGGRVPEVKAAVRIANTAEVTVRPGFGAMLPVRSLGVLHTLGTKGFARFELTRAVEGNGGSIPKGTVIIGKVEGSDAKRLFVSLLGYISGEKLVALGGDIYDTDGAIGVEGKKKKVGSQAAKIFGGLLNTARSLGEAYLLGRKGGSAGYGYGGGIVQGTVSDVMTDERRSYVVVQAGEDAVFMVNDLPSPVTEKQEQNPNQMPSDAELLKMLEK